MLQKYFGMKRALRIGNLAAIGTKENVAGALSQRADISGKKAEIIRFWIAFVPKCDCFICPHRCQKIGTFSPVNGQGVP
jgi:hypothetical protein